MRQVQLTRVSSVWLDQLKKLEEVAVGVFESCHPATPAFFFRRADEFYPLGKQPLVLGLNVVTPRLIMTRWGSLVGPCTRWWRPRLRRNVSKSEGDEVAVVGVEGKGQSVAIKASQFFQVCRSKCLLPLRLLSFVLLSPIGFEVRALRQGLLTIAGPGVKYPE